MSCIHLVNTEEDTGWAVSTTEEDTGWAVSTTEEDTG